MSTVVYVGLFLTSRCVVSTLGARGIKLLLARPDAGVGLGDGGYDRTDELVGLHWRNLQTERL